MYFIYIFKTLSVVTFSMVGFILKFSKRMSERPPRCGLQLNWIGPVFFSVLAGAQSGALPPPLSPPPDWWAAKSRWCSAETRRRCRLPPGGRMWLRYQTVELDLGGGRMELVSVLPVEEGKWRTGVFFLFICFFYNVIIKETKLRRWILCCSRRSQMTKDRTGPSR